jgi:23S rRNA pseudouridine1911/1915/1917 synthase
MDLDILYEDNHLIAVNKKVSDLVQGDKTGDISIDKQIKTYLKRKYNKPGDVFLGVVHRIDRPVSGVVLFARTGKALSRLNMIFKERQLTKLYWAILQEEPPLDNDTLNHYILRNPRINKSFAYDYEKEGAKKASLSYKLKGKSKRYYFVEIELHTGRHHQIRSQLAKIACPIRGDLKYGSKRSNPDGGIDLHARSLELIHPVRKEKLRIIASPPEGELWKEFLIVEES